jgi:hypothetical protein
MTAFFDSAKAIISRFDTQWAAAHPAFPIVHDNQHYDPAEGVDFVNLSVQFTGANAISLGGPDTSLIRHAGILEINFYTALAKGTGLGLQYADEAAALFRLQQFDGVSCGEPIPGVQRERGFAKGRWWSTPLFCVFEYDREF